MNAQEPKPVLLWHRDRLSSDGRQKGAALVVCLIMLLVMTVLSISTMRSATMEERMARNAAFSNRAFRVAESALDTEFADVGNTYFSSAVQSPNTTQDKTVAFLNSGAGASGTAKMQFLNLQHPPPCPGSSVGQGSSNHFVALHFRIDSTGTLQQSNNSTLAQSRIAAGVSYCVPAS